MLKDSAGLLVSGYLGQFVGDVSLSRKREECFIMTMYYGEDIDKGICSNLSELNFCLNEEDEKFGLLSLVTYGVRKNINKYKSRENLLQICNKEAQPYKLNQFTP